MPTLHYINWNCITRSSGTGRTAVFIAMDALYNQGLADGMINVPEFVSAMGLDRRDMIENLDVYAFLYYVLYKSFRTKCFVLSAEQLAHKMKSKHSIESTAWMSNIRKEFNILSSLKSMESGEIYVTKTCSSYTEIYRDAIGLSLSVPGLSSSYNATLLSSFFTRDCFIVWEDPVPDSLLNLVRLLLSHKCCTLICTNPFSEVHPLKSKDWIFVSTDTNTCTTIYYQMEVDSVQQLSSRVMTSVLRLKSSATPDWHEVTVYEMTTWETAGMLPPDVSAVLDVIKLVQLREGAGPKDRIVVLSMDGAKGCAVFCAVYNAIQQLQQDGEVDLFTIVRLLQSRCPEMISDLKEYVVCYQTVAEYIKSKPAQKVDNQKNTTQACKV
ncbi:receptor-type tyrosine-protein phosphatase U-like isoform X1 [Crassostrea virginica]